MSVDIIKASIILARDHMARNDYLAAIQCYVKAIEQLQLRSHFFSTYDKLFLTECFLELADCYSYTNQNELNLACYEQGVSILEAISLEELYRLNGENINFFFKFLLACYKIPKVLTSNDSIVKYTYMQNLFNFLMNCEYLNKDKKSRYQTYILYFCYELRTRTYPKDNTLLERIIHIAEQIVYKTDEDKNFLANVYFDLALLFNEQGNKVVFEILCLTSIAYRTVINKKVSEDYMLIGETYRVLALQINYPSLSHDFYKICELILSSYYDPDDEIELNNLTLKVHSVADTVKWIFSQIDEHQLKIPAIFKIKQQFLQLLMQTATDIEFPKSHLRDVLLEHYFPHLFESHLSQGVYNDASVQNNLNTPNQFRLAEDSPILAIQQPTHIHDTGVDAESEQRELGYLLHR